MTEIILTDTGVESEEAVKIAKNCRHCAMCKVDFLESGVCTSGLERKYVSFYPEGRMDLYDALVGHSIPVTETGIEIAATCTQCGKCDFQCYFVNELRPSKVMKALKVFIASYLENGGIIYPPEEDGVLAELKATVGDNWATNDPAIRIAYHHDLCPHVTFKMPAYVIMPGLVDEIPSIIKILAKNNIPYKVRGNGASSHGLVFSDGAILDLSRLKIMEFDEKNWLVKVGPGIASFDLQREAQNLGYRVNTAEPASLVCANIMTSGLISTFSTTYGVAADNFTDAEFVAPDGSFFTLNGPGSPNLYAFHKPMFERDENNAICVSVSMKLHPVTDDEEGILVPFESLEASLVFAADCATRHIGLAIAILGTEFISTFMAPTKKLAAAAKDVFARQLGMPYLVLFIGDGFALRSVREMGYPYIDQRLYKILFKGLPALNSAGWIDLLRDFSVDEPFQWLRLGQLHDLAETALSSSPARMNQEIDLDLRPFFEKLYTRPEMSDLVWLSTFRIQSSRYCRENPCVALVCYLPMDSALIEEVQERLEDIAASHEVRHEFGFITPIDSGKRCIWEYDYYFDHNDPVEILAIKAATHEACAFLDECSIRTRTVWQLRYLGNQGCSRKESFIFSPST